MRSIWQVKLTFSWLAHSSFADILNFEGAPSDCSTLQLSDKPHRGTRTSMWVEVEHRISVNVPKIVTSVRFMIGVE
jgi:hypothetical protein